ncbi:hypothetical protein M0813_05967 [Anaeramoeba flamelloides]|uniref:Uncharacterized protein n=1 Tax=Anaeramoeba flamelloides TaxID=1746091 RepID=A0ABQ8XF03_9EUKA|nr:hypothetical protein M0813_05967 [Anaeramoeba flamelloides]
MSEIENISYFTLSELSRKITRMSDLQDKLVEKIQKLERRIFGLTEGKFSIVKRYLIMIVSYLWLVSGCQNYAKLSIFIRKIVRKFDFEIIVSIEQQNICIKSAENFINNIRREVSVEVSLIGLIIWNDRNENFTEEDVKTIMSKLIKYDKKISLILYSINYDRESRIRYNRTIEKEDKSMEIDNKIEQFILSIPDCDINACFYLIFSKFSVFDPEKHDKELIKNQINAIVNTFIFRNKKLLIDIFKKFSISEDLYIIWEEQRKEFIHVILKMYQARFLGLFLHNYKNFTVFKKENFKLLPKFEKINLKILTKLNKKDFFTNWFKKTNFNTINQWEFVMCKIRKHLPVGFKKLINDYILSILLQKKYIKIVQKISENVYNNSMILQKIMLMKM